MSPEIIVDKPEDLRTARPLVLERLRGRAKVRRLAVEGDYMKVVEVCFVALVVRTPW